MDGLHPVRFTGRAMPEPPFHLPPLKAESRSFVAGAWAGLVAESILHPFDTVSTRLKAQAAASPKYTGFAQAVRTIVAEEGVLGGLFAGIGATLLFAGPATAIYFGSYETAKAWGAAVIPSPSYAPAVHLAAGALSELASSVVVVPQEVIKSRMQLGANPSVSTGGWLTTQSNYRNAVHAIVSIVREEGVRGLYAGFRACVAVDCTFGAIQFVLYEHLKSLHRLRTGKLPTDELSTAEALGAGAAAGGLAGLATNPLDVVAARLMVQGGGEGGGERGAKVAGEAAGGNREAAVRYTGALHCYRETVRREGARALWNGAVPRVLSIAPVVAVQFAVYEAIKGWLGVDEDFDFDDQ